MKSENLDISLLLDFYGEILTFRQREMLELYYDQDMSLAEISEHAGITRQGVLDAIRRAEKQLFEIEEKLGLVARLGRMKTGFELILMSAQEIYEINRKGCFSEDIGRAAGSIIETATELSQE